MRKLGLLFALIVMLAGVSVQAQKGFRPRISPPTPEPSKKIVLQDDNGGGYLVFDPMSGVYECKLCEYGYVLSGTGRAEIDGCSVYFSDIQEGYRIFASLNMCDHQAKAVIEIFSLKDLGFDIEPMSESWSDTDMQDDTGDCDVKLK